MKNTNLYNLYKQICLEEAKHLNEFWNNSTQKLSELESKIKDEKLKERTRELRYIKLCEDINDILQYDGYNGDYEDVIEYFDRAGFKFRISNCYFDIHPKLKGLYTLLQKCNKTNDLQQLQKEYNYIVQKMKAFSHITEEVLINSILLAFQELVPPGFNIHKPNILSNAFISEPVFPHTIEVQQQFVDRLLVDWYKNNINDYLLTPMMNLKEHERTRLFKIY